MYDQPGAVQKVGITLIEDQILPEKRGSRTSKQKREPVTSGNKNKDEIMELQRKVNSWVFLLGLELTFGGEQLEISEQQARKQEEILKNKIELMKGERGQSADRMIKQQETYESIIKALQQTKPSDHSSSPIKPSNIPKAPTSPA